MAREEKVLGISRRAMKADRIRLAAAKVYPVITRGRIHRYTVELHRYKTPSVYTAEGFGSHESLSEWYSHHLFHWGARRAGKRLVKRYARAVAFNQSQSPTGTS